MSEIIQTKRFNEIDLSDSFFESLKSDYPGFEDWFRKKDTEEVLVQYADEGLMPSGVRPLSSLRYRNACNPSSAY